MWSQSSVNYGGLHMNLLWSVMEVARCLHGWVLGTALYW